MGRVFPIPPVFLALPMVKMSGTAMTSGDSFAWFAGERLLERSRTQNIMVVDIIMKWVLPGWLVKLE